MCLSGFVSDADTGQGEVTKIRDKAEYNSFVDLFRFQDQWYCTFREGNRHVYGGDDTKGRASIYLAKVTLPE